MRRRCALFLALSACAGAEDRFAQAPDLGQMATAMVVAHTSDGTAVVAADATSSAWRLDVEVTQDADVVELLGYRCTLEELGVAAGALSIVPDGDLLPDPTTSFRHDLEAGTFVPTERPSQATRDLRIAVRTQEPCATIEAEVVYLTGVVSQVRTLIVLERDRVLIGMREGFWMEVERNGSFREVFVGQVGESGRYHGAARRPDGSFLFVDGWRGCLGTATDLDTITPVGACLYDEAPESLNDWIHVAAGPDEAFVLTAIGDQFRVSGTVIEDLGWNDHVHVGRKGAVMRLGPGRALFAGPQENAVLRWEHDGFRAETAALQFFDKLTGLGSSERHGVVAISNAGDLLAPEGGEWTNIGATGALSPRHVVEIDGHLFVSGEGVGQVVQFTSDGVACDAAYVAGNHAERMVAHGDDELVLATHVEGGDMEIHFLRPVFPGMACDQ